MADTDNTPVEENAPDRSAVNYSRRNLGKAAVAAPVILSAVSRSAWGTGYKCSISGDVLSGNVSQPTHTHNCHGSQGCKPWHWKKYVGQWNITGCTPGGYYKVEKNSQGHIKKGSSSTPGQTGCGFFCDGHEWQTLFPGLACPPDSPIQTYTKLHKCLPDSSSSQPNLASHLIAACLNAMGGYDYGSNVLEIKEAYQACLDAYYGGDIVPLYNLKEVLTNLNNRSCPSSGGPSCPDSQAVWVNGQYCGHHPHVIVGNYCIPCFYSWV